MLVSRTLGEATRENKVGRKKERGIRKGKDWFRGEKELKQTRKGK